MGLCSIKLCEDSGQARPEPTGRGARRSSRIAPNPEPAGREGERGQRERESRAGRVIGGCLWKYVRGRLGAVCSYFAHFFAYARGYCRRAAASPTATIPRLSIMGVTGMAENLSRLVYSHITQPTIRIHISLLGPISAQYANSDKLTFSLNEGVGQICGFRFIHGPPKKLLFQAIPLAITPNGLRKVRPPPGSGRPLLGWTPPNRVPA